MGAGGMEADAAPATTDITARVSPWTRLWSRRGVLQLGGGGLASAALLTDSRRAFARHSYRPGEHGGPWTIGVLSHASVADPALAGFKTGMAEYGYVDGTDIFYHYRGVLAEDMALAEGARRFVRDRVSLILTLTTKAALAALTATTAAERGPPVLFAPASNPVSTGLVQSLRRPGGPITGVTFTHQEPRRLDWLRRLVPGLKTIYVPYNSADPSPISNLVAIRGTAARLGLNLELAPLGHWEAVRQALSVPRPGVDALFMLPDPILASHTDEMAVLARNLRLPFSVPHRDGVEQGALMSYGFDLRELGVQAARLAVMILSGIRPADIPVEIAEFSLAINRSTAEALGLSIPDAILRQARVLRS